MTSHEEGMLPRGFARYGTLPDRDEGRAKSRMLALAEPASSLITLHPPDHGLAREEHLLYFHQLITVAKLEEQQHASYQRCCGIRNLRLLEHQAHYDLFQADLSAAETKAALVQSELACEALFRNLVELIETHDKFLVSTLLKNEADLSESAIFDELYVTELAQALEVEQEVVSETVDRITAAASRDQPVVNTQIREQLEELRAVCPRLDLPRLAVVMAIDFPEIVSPFADGEAPDAGPEAPFSVVDEPTVAVETIDVTDRFDRIVEVFRRPSVQRELDRCPPNDLVATAVNAVEQHSTVEIAETRERGTLHQYPVPLLDSVRAATADSETLGRQLRSEFLQIVPATLADGEVAWAALLQTIGELFYHVGGAAVQDEFILVNPYVSAEWYAELWIQEYVARRLVEQILHITVDETDTRVRHPLHTFRWGSPGPDDVAAMVAFGQVSADEFSEVTVNGEEELRRARAARADGVPTG